MAKKDFNNNTLAQMRTLLANQRTYLAYIRTGFAVTALAIKTKSNIVIAIGMLLIGVGLYQYYTTASNIEKGTMVLRPSLPPESSIIISLLPVSAWGSFRTFLRCPGLHPYRPLAAKLPRRKFRLPNSILSNVICRTY